MKISDIDKNFEIFKLKVDGKLVEVPSNDVALFGLQYDKAKGFHRMSIDIANNISDGVKGLNYHTSGGRIAFSTNSDVLKIYVKYDYLGFMPHMALTGSSGFSLNEVIKGKEHHVSTFMLDTNAKTGYSSVKAGLDNKKMHNYVLYFPLYNPVSDLTLEIAKDADIKPFNPYKNTKPFVYYGSSITQGGCASRSDTSYQAFVSKWTNVDFINLGFSGSAKGEQLMAEYIGKLKMYCFIMDYDHNANTPEDLLATHEPFFKTFRKYQPNTPVILMCAPNYSESPKYYSQRAKIIKETYIQAIANGDKNVYFLSGKSIIPPSISESTTVDTCHPTDLGFYYMAKAVFKIVKKIF